MPFIVVDNNLQRVTDFDAARAQIDAEIAQLETQLANLRFRRNALCPVMQLPPDILLEVMKEYKRLSWDTFDSLSSLTISHVSRYWRGVALQAPFLWDTIVCPRMSPACVEAFILRSGRATLALSLNDSGYSGTPLLCYWSTISPWLDKIADRIGLLLCKSTQYDSIPGQLAELLDYSTAPLKILDVHRCDDLYKNWIPAFNLESLCISNGAFGPRLISSDLIVLKLHDLDMESLSSMDGFHQVLSSLTKLQLLELGGVISCLGRGDEREQGTTLPNLRLPSLVSLELRDQEGSVADFLACLIPPRLRTLAIELQNFYYRDSSSPSLKRALYRALKNTPHRYSQGFHLDLCVENYRSYRLRLSHLRPEVESKELDFDFSWASQAEVVESVHRTLAIIPRLELNSLTLDWNWDGYLESTTFRAILRLFSTYATLTEAELGANSSILSSCVPNCECWPKDHHTRRFVNEVVSHPPLAPLPACRLCQGVASDILPALHTLTLKTNGLPDTNDITLFLAHRSDCGRPLKRLNIKVQWYDHTPGCACDFSLFRDWLERMGDVIRCYLEDERQYIKCRC